jgi:hypothetical protein
MTIKKMHASHEFPFSAKKRRFPPCPAPHPPRAQLCEEFSSQELATTPEEALKGPATVLRCGIACLMFLTTSTTYCCLLLLISLFRRGTTRFEFAHVAGSISSSTRPTPTATLCL